MSRLANGLSECLAVLVVREAFHEAQDAPEKIPAKLKPLIAMPDFPEKLVNMVEKAAA